MNFIRTLFEKYKSKNQHNKEVEIGSTFYVKEKDGKLWILHNGYAVQEIEETLTAKEVVNILTNFRMTAIKY